MANLTYRTVKPGDVWIDPANPARSLSEYKGRENLLQLWETGPEGRLAGDIMTMPLRSFFRASANVNPVDGMKIGNVFLNSKQAKGLEDALRVDHERDYQIAVPLKHRLAIGEYKKRPPGLSSVVMPIIKSLLNNFANATTSDLHVPGPRL